jgi:hypothetical protein
MKRSTGSARSGPGRWTLAIACSLSIAAAACGGGGGGSANSPAGGGGGSPPKTNAGAGSDLQKQLESFGREWGTTSAKVTYKVTGTDPGASEMTLFWEPPDSSRMDIVDEQGNTSTFIATKDATYFCGGSAQQQCLKIQGTSGAPISVPFFGLFAAPNALDEQIAAGTAGVDLHTSNETIAGISATCFTAGGSSAGSTGAGEWCFSDKGILLLVDGNGSSTGPSSSFRMEATSVSETVSASDFQPPYPVTELPGGFPTTPTG